MSKSYRMKRRKRFSMLKTGERKHAWYSESMARVAGAAIYKKPSGKNVAVTIISDVCLHECGWDDMRYLGLVVGWEFGGLVRGARTAICY